MPRLPCVIERENSAAVSDGEQILQNFYSVLRVGLCVDRGRILAPGVRLGRTVELQMSDSPESAHRLSAQVYPNGHCSIGSYACP
jgi:hypothetical protein